MNVCGITSKLKIPEFHYFIENNDIIVCAETKIDNCDHVMIPGYVLLPQKHHIEKKKANGNSGVCLKDRLCTMCKEIVTTGDSEFDNCLLWCVIHKVSVMCHIIIQDLLHII